MPSFPYLRGWDVALMPFAINEATRFISPTKTPEYLAAGRPVVSTPVPDVVRHYGGARGSLSGDAVSFVPPASEALLLSEGTRRWLSAVDQCLASTSWDQTFCSKCLFLWMRSRSRRRRCVPLRHPAVSERTVDILRLSHCGCRICRIGSGRTTCLIRQTSVSVRPAAPCSRQRLSTSATKAGILVHKYGPHIFHTNSEDIFRLSFPVHTLAVL